MVEFGGRIVWILRFKYRIHISVSWYAPFSYNCCKHPDSHVDSRPSAVTEPEWLLWWYGINHNTQHTHRVITIQNCYTKLGRSAPTELFVGWSLLSFHCNISLGVLLNKQNVSNQISLKIETLKKQKLRRQVLDQYEIINAQSRGFKSWRDLREDVLQLSDEMHMISDSRGYNGRAALQYVSRMMSAVRAMSNSVLNSECIHEWLISIYLVVYSLHHNVLPTLQSMPLMTNGPLYPITQDSSCHGQHTINIPQDLYSVSSETPYRIILWNLEAARFGFRLQVTFKNMGNQFTQTHNGLVYKPYSTPRVCILYRHVASYNNHRWYMTGEYQRSIIQMKVTGNVYDPVVQIARLKKYAR